MSPNAAVINSRRNSPVFVNEPYNHTTNGALLQRSRSGSKQSFHSPSTSLDHGDRSLRDLAITSARLSSSGSLAVHDSWTLEALRTDLEDGSDDEFFDAPGTFHIMVYTNRFKF